jgi:hypothetical protein
MARNRPASTSARARASQQVLLGEIQRLDAIAGVVAQTGFAATAAAFTVASTANLPDFVKWTLVVAGGVCVFPTVVACVSANYDPLPNGVTHPEKKRLEATYAKKKRRSKAALFVLALTIEAAAGAIFCYLIS